jgi:hypothetical protein
MKQCWKTFRMVIPARLIPPTIISSRAIASLMRLYLTSYTSNNRCLPIENFSNSVIVLIKKYLLHKKSGYMTHFDNYLPCPLYLFPDELREVAAYFV